VMQLVDAGIPNESEPASGMHRGTHDPEAVCTTENAEREAV
jgi:hypothetical protein